MTNTQKWFVLGCLLLGMVGGPAIYAQLQQSGGPGSTVTANIGTTNGLALDATLTGGTQKTKLVDSGGTYVATVSAAGAVKVDGSGVTQPVSGTFWQATQPVSGTFWQATQPVSGTVSVNALPAGTANIGFVRILPSACTQSTNFSNTTAQVATSTGTTVTSTTTCVTSAYANNITNSAVTLRLADKQGTPVIWLGGNADFSIPANSNVKIPIDGVTFTSGITAIAGTGSAINLQINGVQ